MYQSNTKSILINSDSLKGLHFLEDKNNFTGKFNVIIVDPPYNTGNKVTDKFVYKDDRTLDEWSKLIVDTFSKAKELLTEDGIIFINIDENVYHLKLLLDDIFGKNNFIENFIWVKNSTKNNSKTNSHNHEYILCYAKNKPVIETLNYFKIAKQGLREVEEQRQIILSLKDLSLEEKKNLLEESLKQLYKSNPQVKKNKGIKHYKFVDDNLDIYRISDVSAPGGKGYQHTILHPITNKICKNPVGGYRFNTEKVNELLRNNLFYFGKTEKTVPQIKRYLKDMETEVAKSVFENFDDGIKDLQRILPSAYFNNPKPVSLIQYLLSFVNKRNEDLKVLDFFCGSGSTVQACIEYGVNTVVGITNNENNIFYNITVPRIKAIDNNVEVYDL